jgi:hypothetical protein
VEFQPVTLVPFEPKLIDYSLMTVAQIEWYNAYNEVIVSKVSDKIEVIDERTLKWIQDRTKYVSPVISNEIQRWKGEL